MSAKPVAAGPNSYPVIRHLDQDQTHTAIVRSALVAAGVREPDQFMAAHVLDSHVGFTNLPIAPGKTVMITSVVILGATPKAADATDTPAPTAGGKP